MTEPWPEALVEREAIAAYYGQDDIDINDIDPDGPEAAAITRIVELVKRRAALDASGLREAHEDIAILRAQHHALEVQWLEMLEAVRRHVASFEPGSLAGSELFLANLLQKIDGDKWSPWCVPGELVAEADEIARLTQERDALQQRNAELVEALEVPNDDMIERVQKVVAATGTSINDAQAHDIIQAIADEIAGVVSAKGETP